MAIDEVFIILEAATKTAVAPAIHCVVVFNALAVSVEFLGEEAIFGSDLPELTGEFEFVVELVLEEELELREMHDPKLKTYPELHFEQIEELKVSHSSQFWRHQFIFGKIIIFWNGFVYPVMAEFM